MSIPITANAAIKLGILRGGAAPRYIVESLGTVLAVLAIVIGLHALAATALPRPDPYTYAVDRTRKGDRSVPASAAHLDQAREINLRRAPVFDQKLSDGCEALVSALTYSPLAHVAARCVS